MCLQVLAFVLLELVAQAPDLLQAATDFFLHFAARRNLRSICSKPTT